jgi:hypothetical protein
LRAWLGRLLLPLWACLRCGGCRCGSRDGLRLPLVAGLRLGAGRRSVALAARWRPLAGGRLRGWRGRGGAVGGARCRRGGALVGCCCVWQAGRRWRAWFVARFRRRSCCRCCGSWRGRVLVGRRGFVGSTCRAVGSSVNGRLAVGGWRWPRRWPGRGCVRVAAASVFRRWRLAILQFRLLVLGRGCCRARAAGCGFSGRVLPG